MSKVLCLFLVFPAVAFLVLRFGGNFSLAQTAGPAESNPKAELAAPPGPASGEKAAGKEAGSAEAPKTLKHPETLLEYAVAGGWLMVPIGLCSIIWLAFLAERLIATRRGLVLPAALVKAVQGWCGGGSRDLGAARTLCEAHPSAAAAILKMAVDRIGEPMDELERGVNNVAQREIYSLRRNLRLFSIIASVAPLLGLLGTVTGMVQCFREVAEQGLGSGQNLAPGIYQALITTVGGLLVAIPSLLTYYWLSARVDQYVHQLDILVVDFVDACRFQKERTTA